MGSWYDPMEGGGRSIFQAPSAGVRAVHKVHFTAAVYTYIFLSRWGEPLKLTSISVQFKAAAIQPGHPYVNFHGFRRGHGTGLVIAGANSKVAQKRLGHANVAITRQINSGSTAEQDRGAASAFDTEVS